MHDIEPYFRWRDEYTSEQDERSPFYGRVYNEFQFTQKVYNYFIHPQWDEFGSSTLYMKLLYTNYSAGFAIIELIGEWNDCLHNDIMFLKREIIDQLALHGIRKYLLICENVLNFHGDGDDYYEEWYEEIIEDDGWICFLNTLDHVTQEMKDTRIDQYVHFGNHFASVNWRPHKPKALFQLMEGLIEGRIQRLPAGF